LHLLQLDEVRVLLEEFRLAGEFFAPRGLDRVFLLSSDPFALVAGLVKASKSDLLCIQRRKTKTLRLGAFEDI